MNIKHRLNPKFPPPLTAEQIRIVLGDPHPKAVKIKLPRVSKKRWK